MIEVFNIKKGILIGVLNLNEFAVSEKLTAKRDIESKGKEFLIKQLINEAAKIAYSETGKPFLVNNNNHISISHSHNKLVIILNDTEPTGIDIELIRDKVLRVKHKFLSTSEILDAGDSIEKLLIYWAAKETLYKIYGTKNINYIYDLTIEPFLLSQNGSIIGHINLSNYKEKFTLNYQTLDNYILVYALNKIKNC